MSQQPPPFEIHVHGDVRLRDEVDFPQIQEALKPLWKYVGARSLVDAAPSHYEDEPGIRFDPNEHLLQLCWTLEGDEDFRLAIDEACMGLNEIAATGAALEVSFYDIEFDEEEAPEEEEARDDFVLCFVGPTPAAIMQVQRDLLVQDVVNLMERHFDASELTDVVQAIDRLFTDRFEALVSSMQLGRPPRGAGPAGGHGGHGGPRKPRHLH
ncbi:MAG TPA: hypothetical protein DCY89_05440 [Gammaproteobacteria bacterium]|nr:hypothetical protein [Gammaproteobacteria bacterium]